MGNQYPSMDSKKSQKRLSKKAKYVERLVSRSATDVLYIQILWNETNLHPFRSGLESFSVFFEMKWHMRGSACLPQWKFRCFEIVRCGCFNWAESPINLGVRSTLSRRCCRGLPQWPPRCPCCHRHYKQEAVQRHCRCDVFPPNQSLENMFPPPLWHQPWKPWTYTHRPPCPVKPLKCDSPTGRRTIMFNLIQTKNNWCWQSATTSVNPQKLRSLQRVCFWFFVFRTNDTPTQGVGFESSGMSRKSISSFGQFLVIHVCCP